MSTFVVVMTPTQAALHRSDCEHLDAARSAAGYWIHFESRDKAERGLRHLRDRGERAGTSCIACCGG